MNGSLAKISLAAIMVGGAVLRLWDLGEQPLWSDEALTAVIAQAPSLALAIEPLDATGPLYYWLHQFFVGAGAGPAASRTISAIAGILLIPITYAAARQLLDRKGALLASALVALSFPLIDYSKEARSYSLLVLLVGASAWTLMRAASEFSPSARKLWICAFVIVGTASLYTHLVAFFVLGCWLVIAQQVSQRQGVFLRREEVYASIVAFEILALPEIVRIVRYVRESSSGFSWLKEFTPGEFLHLIAVEWLPFAQDAGAWFGIAAIAALLVGFIAAKVEFETLWRSRPLALSVLGAWLAQPLLLWLASLLDPILMYRTILPSWPAFAIAGAVAVNRFKGRWWRIIACLILATYGMSLARIGVSRSKEGWNEVVLRLNEANADAVIACANWKAPALLAQMHGALDIPVIVRQEREWLRVDDARLPWPQAFARGAWMVEKNDWLGQPPEAERAVVSARRVALVESECTDRESRAAISGLGGVKRAEWSFLGSGEANASLGQAAPIDLLILEFVEPVAIPVRKTRN